MVVGRRVEWGARGLMGTEFQFGKMKIFWRWMEMLVVQHYGYIEYH